MNRINLHLMCLPKSIDCGYQYDNKETTLCFNGIETGYTYTLRIDLDGTVYLVPLENQCFTITNAFTQLAQPFFIQVIATGADYQKAYKKIACKLKPTLDNPTPDIDYPDEYISYIQQLVNDSISVEGLTEIINDYFVLNPINQVKYVPQSLTSAQKAQARNNIDAAPADSIPSRTSQLTNDSGFITSSGLATVATSGSYADLSNKPTIPTVPSNVSAFTNDAGYITDTGIPSTTGNAGKVLTVNSGATGVEWTTPSGGEDELFIIQSTGSGSSLTVDKTFAEIVEEHTNGKICLLINSNRTFVLGQYTANKVVFVLNVYSQSSSINLINVYSITINSDNTLAYASKSWTMTVQLPLVAGTQGQMLVVNNAAGTQLGYANVPTVDSTITSGGTNAVNSSAVIAYINGLDASQEEF